jgi:DNA-binding winged helix-turn-helix (wHTH) protein
LLIGPRGRLHFAVFGVAMTTYRLGRIEIDDASYTFRFDGLSVNIQRRVFDFIMYLLEQRERVVCREELRSVVWAGCTVSDAAIDRCASVARRALQDPRAIRTVHGRGYQWAATFFAAPASETHLMVEATKATSESHIKSRVTVADDE